MRILLVEDQRDAAEILMKGLREQGYAMDFAADGEEADFKASVNPYDLIILDVMLPGKNGFEVCRQLRAAGSDVPILILTAHDAVKDRIQGLDLGADDYMVKPFEYPELLARVHVLLRRRAVRSQEIHSVADLSIEVGTRKVKRATKANELTAKEFALLEYLARRQGELVTRQEIARHVWDDSYDAFSNLIEIYLGRLRRKIDSGEFAPLLHTKRGAGYVLGIRISD